MSRAFPHPYGMLAQRYRRLRRSLPLTVSALALEEFHDNFGREGVGGYRTAAGFKQWVRRKAIPRNARDRSRSVLMKSSRLRRGLRPSPTYRFARVINRVPYAAIHNEGGKIRGHKRVLRRSPKTGKLRWVATSAPAKMPKRPFMESSPQLMDAIEDELFHSLDQIFR